MEENSYTDTEYYDGRAESYKNGYEEGKQDLKSDIEFFFKSYQSNNNNSDINFFIDIFRATIW